MLLLFAAFLLFGIYPVDTNAQQRPPALPDQPAQVNPDTDQTSEGRRLYIKGLAEMEFENYSDAARLLLEAREKLGERPAVDFAIAQAFTALENDIEAVYYAENAVRLDDTNKWYRILLAEVYQNLGRSGESIKQLEEVISRHPGDIQVLYTIARIHSLEGNLEQANATYDRIISRNGPDMQLLYQKYRNYSMMGEQNSAMEQLEGMLELDADNTAAMQILAQMYIEQNNISRAIEILERAYSINASDEETVISLSDLYIREERWEEAGVLLEQIISNEEVDGFTKIELIQYMMGRLSRNLDSDGLKETTENLLNRLMETQPDFGYVYALAAEFYNLTGDNENLLKNLKKTNELLPENEPAWRQHIQLLLIDERYEEAIEIARLADKAIPDDAFVLFFKANAHLLLKQNAQAIPLLERARSVPAGRDFRAVVLGVLGDAYSGDERYEEAFESYEQALRLDPNNDVVLNNFAYFLSLQSKRLDEALEMSQRAVEAEPENAAYLDTLGWVHFKMGNYNEAREFIKASIDTGDASAVVLEHMGDVYEKLGDLTNARHWWQKALEKDSTKEHLHEKISAE